MIGGQRHIRGSDLFAGKVSAVQAVHCVHGHDNRGTFDVNVALPHLFVYAYMHNSAIFDALLDDVFLQLRLPVGFGGLPLMVKRIREVRIIASSQKKDADLLF